MKKILIVVLCVVLAVAMVGCGTPTETPSESVEAIATPEPTVEATPEPTPAMLDKEVKLERISFSVPSRWQEDRGENEVFYYPISNVKDNYVHIMSQTIDDVYYYLFSKGLQDEGCNTPEEYALHDQIETRLVNDGIFDYCTVEDVNINGLEGVKYYSDNTGRAGYEIFGCALAVKGIMYTFEALGHEVESEPLITMPYIVDSVYQPEPKDDFLKNEEMRSQVTSLMNNFQFVDIATLADSYIEEQSPVNTDSVYEIKQYAEQANAVMTNCSIVTDDFENKSTLFGTVDAISADINFVPFIDNEVKTFDLKAKVGFKQNGWLFMDNVSIKVDEDDYLTEFFSDPTRDIISGGTILEEDIMELKYEEADKIINAEAPIMRFEGEDGKTRDHDMTSAEVESLKSISIVSQSIDGIRAIIKQWTEENIY